jgi:hypothetical protein
MIHCEKCKHINASEAEKCAKCGTNLLPGEDITARLGGMGCLFILAVLLLIFAWVIIPGWTEGGPSLETLIEMGFTFILGPLAALCLVLGGIWWALRKTPLPERYDARAKRHEKLDRKQAIADYSAMIKLASGSGKNDGQIKYADGIINYADVLTQRGELYAKEGSDAKAKEDWTTALELLDREISIRKQPEPDMQEKRAKVNRLLKSE